MYIIVLYIKSIMVTIWFNLYIRYTIIITIIMYFTYIIIYASSNGYIDELLSNTLL